MSPASYRAAPPRVASTTLAHRSQQPQNAPLPRPDDRGKEAHYPADGDGEPPPGEADGEPDGEPDGVGVPAVCCAFWYSAIASWSAWSACPYLTKSPACCAALRSPSALLILSMAAWTAALPFAGGVVVWGGGEAVPLGCCPAAASSCFSAPGRSAANPTYCPKLTSTYLSCGYELA